MAKVTVLFKNRTTLTFDREGYEKDAADSVFREVTQLLSTGGKALLNLEKGGGLDAREVVAVVSGGAKIKLSDTEESTGGSNSNSS